MIKHCGRGVFQVLGMRSRVDSDGNFVGKSEYKSTNGIMLDHSVKVPILGALGQVQWGVQLKPSNVTRVSGIVTTHYRVLVCR